MVVGDFPALGGKVVASNQTFFCVHPYMDVSENSGTPKSSILIGFSIINYKPSILGFSPLFLETPIWGRLPI